MMVKDTILTSLFQVVVLNRSYAMPKVDRVAPIPMSIRLTPVQGAVLSSARYSGKSGVIIRFFLDKLIDGELPHYLIDELEQHLDDLT
jgi:hypothetical protein